MSGQTPPPNRSALRELGPLPAKPEPGLTTPPPPCPGFSLGPVQALLPWLSCAAACPLHAPQPGPHRFGSLGRPAAHPSHGPLPETTQRSPRERRGGRAVSSHRTKGGEWVGLLPAGCVSAPQPHRGLTRPRPQPRIPPPLRPAVGSPRPGPHPATRRQPPSLPAPTRRPDAVPGGPAKPPPGRGRAPPPLCRRSVPLRPPPAPPRPCPRPRPAPHRPTAPPPAEMGVRRVHSTAQQRRRAPVALGSWTPQGSTRRPRKSSRHRCSPTAREPPRGRFSPASALKFRCSPHPAAHQSTPVTRDRRLAGP